MSIEIINLSKTFKPENIHALNNVSIKFKSNQISGLIGFNGSGKTTMFNMITECIESKDSGKILFDNKKADLELKRQMTFTTTGWSRKDRTKAKNHLIKIGKLYDANPTWIKEKIDYYSKLLGFKRYLYTPIKALSKGNKQKIKVIASFLNPNCKYMFLDEPFEGLDPIMVKLVKEEYMKLKNITIIISSHLMEVVNSMVKEFYVLKDGEIVDFKDYRNKEIIIRVNKEVPMTSIKKLKFVIKINTEVDYTDIIIDDLKNFQKVNKKLMESSKYTYSSLVEKNIASSVFEKYKGDK